MTVGIDAIHPLWSPDGQTVVFTASGENRGYNLHSIAASGDGMATQLTMGESFDYPNSWAPDDKTLIYQACNISGSECDISSLVLGDELSSVKLLGSAAEERHAAISPDGRWIAYTSNRTGRDEIYVRSCPNLEGLMQISTEGGRDPRWSGQGSELFYLAPQSMMTVAVSANEDFEYGNPQPIFELDSGYTLTESRYQSFDVSIDVNFHIRRCHSIDSDHGRIAHGLEDVVGSLSHIGPLMEFPWRGVPS